NMADQPNDGVIHVTLDRQKTKGWSIFDDDEADREMLNAFAEALEKAGDYIDFASYDSNADGYVQNSELAICFVVAGKNASTYPGYQREPSQYIWPHAWSYSDFKKDDAPAMPVVDGVAIDRYIAIAESETDASGSVAQGEIGVLTHELGHYLGLPDLYSNGEQSGEWFDYGVSYLSLMDQGCYGVDLEGNSAPFSLDMWSRVRLGWVDPAILNHDTQGNVQIAGSLSNSQAPIAYRLDTPNEGEYYLVENRRFTSWDEGMGKYYPYAASEDSAGEDLGGGLLLWHIDDKIVDEYRASNKVNDYDHHPGVMPLFYEIDEDYYYCIIGSSIDKNNPFFDRDAWDDSVELPIYGTMANDTRDDRTLSTDLVLALESGSAPVMDLHLHALNPTVLWSEDHSMAALEGICGIDMDRVILDVTTDITSEVVKKPSTTESGTSTYTVRFSRFGWEETTNGLIPPLDETAVSARDVALAAMTDLITGANAALAQGAYTTESFDALKGAIKAANELYVDDTTTEADVSVAQKELIRTWRLLEPVNTYALDPTERVEREARNKAMLDLADLLCQTFDTVDAQAYKPTAYASYAEVVERAYDVFANEDSTTQELVDARTNVMRALTQLKKNGKRTSLSAATISGLKTLTYNGKVRKPKPTVSLGKKKLVMGTDYKLTYANNKSAGKATVTVVGAGDYTGKASATFTIAKAKNTLSVKGRTATVSYAKVKKASQNLSVSKVVKFSSKGVGKLTYAKVSGNAKIVVNKTSGKITVKKGLKKGTYKVKVRVRAAGGASHASSKKTVTCTVRVK
ncbi:MAG: M6 family metalloprotease domain-containing protein, partial [Atopobiaceae bacterium]|nr:M6 family metalloprotease domain-containing protein [Atopobiaceae bacterium]